MPKAPRPPAFTAPDFDARRRRALHAAAALAAVTSVAAASPAAMGNGMHHRRRVPTSGQTLPVVGLGSWITFNVGDDPVGRARCTAVMRAFFEEGGGLIDSSPMYGSSQAVIGHALAQISPPPEQLFAADKVWTTSRGGGAAQAEASRRLWNLPRLALLQVHNLVAWEAHLPLLLRMKSEGRLGHVGVTTSHGRRHSELESLMRTQPLDFVQLSYSPVERDVERRLLPLAAERGIAVIANRPFDGGALPAALQRHPLPPEATELGCRHWSTLLLKWTVSHPALTCAIPATSRVDHLRENMAAARGPLPDAGMRERISGRIRALVG